MIGRLLFAYDMLLKAPFVRLIKLNLMNIFVLLNLMLVPLSTYLWLALALMTKRARAATYTIEFGAATVDVNPNDLKTEWLTFPGFT